MSKLSQDLVSIRKEMRLNKQNVFEKCRVPLETIEAIEDGSIFTGKTRNKTYLRSYLRTYAKAIGISDEDIIMALDEQGSTGYNGLLAKKYLSKTDSQTKDIGTDDADQSGSPDKDSAPDSGSKAGSTDVPDKPSESAKKAKSGPENDLTTVAEKSAIAKNESPEQKKKRITPESQGKTVEDIEWEDQTLKKPHSTSTSEFASSESYKPETPSKDLPPPPDVKTVDWATKVKEAVYRPQKNRLMWVIIAIILALSMASAAIYWYWQQTDIPIGITPPAEETAPVQTGEPAAPDNGGTAAAETGVPADPFAADSPDEAETTPETPDAAPADPAPEDISARVLEGAGSGDTLYVIAYALHGNLEPIRVFSDVFATGDNAATALRPYWVEQQEAMRFEFVDEIIFQGTLARMVLIFNGHVIDDFSDIYLDGSRISLTRDFIMENEDLLIPNETPFAQIAAPGAVQERPRFSP